MSDTDMELLARYTRQHAEDAFAEIVRRLRGVRFMKPEEAWEFMK